jgi:hypothetical protein
MTKETLQAAQASILNATALNKMASGPVFLEDAYKQIVSHLKRLTALCHLCRSDKICRFRPKPDPHDISSERQQRAQSYLHPYNLNQGVVTGVFGRLC